MSDINCLSKTEEKTKEVEENLCKFTRHIYFDGLYSVTYY